jgi:hypothetical protein
MTTTTPGGQHQLHLHTPCRQASVDMLAECHHSVSSLTHPLNVRVQGLKSPLDRHTHMVSFHEGREGNRDILLISPPRECETCDTHLTCQCVVIANTRGPSVPVVYSLLNERIKREAGVSTSLCLGHRGSKRVRNLFWNRHSPWHPFCPNCP